MTPSAPSATERTTHACMEVHRRLGPGFWPQTYVEALGQELYARGLSFQKCVQLPAFYRGVRLDAAYALDLCVEREVAVLVRTVPSLLPVHRAELRAVLRISGLDHGIVVNFQAAELGLVVLKRVARGRLRSTAGPDEPTLVSPPPPAKVA